MENRIVVLGSSGLLGTAITRVCDCIPIDHSEADIRDLSQLISVFEQYKPTVVINAIGVVGINVCESNPLSAIDINSNSVCYLVDLCRECGATIIQPSTHNVFDGAKDGYYTENDEPRPLQIYGITKYLAEKIVARYEKHYIVRYPTLFGRRINNRSAFPNKIIDWIKEGKTFKVSYDKIDSPSYSVDVARETVKLLDKPFGIYHIANSGSTNYYDFVLNISELLGIEAKVIKVKEQEFETMAPNALKTAMSSVKLQPLRTWDKALEEYLNEIH
jgi:dTDP-4-dehydrorhamnose reductase